MFKKKNINILISQKNCIGCELCVEVCPRKVLGMIYRDDKIYATVEYKDRCIACRKCETLCPTEAISINK